MQVRAVIDSTDIDISIHIFKYRYIDTHLKISIYNLKKNVAVFLYQKSLFSIQRNV